MSCMEISVIWIYYSSNLWEGIKIKEIDLYVTVNNGNELYRGNKLLILVIHDELGRHLYIYDTSYTGQIMH